MKLTVLLLCAMLASGYALADDQSAPLPNEKQPAGLWKAEDCKKIQAGSANFLAVAGKLLEEAGRLKDSGKPEEAAKNFQSALEFSELASNFANNYAAYCRP